MPFFQRRVRDAQTDKERHGFIEMNAYRVVRQLLGRNVQLMETQPWQDGVQARDEEEAKGGLPDEG